MLPLLKLENIASKVEIAGPGFINIFLDKQWIAKQIELTLQHEKLAINSVTPQTIIIDYSAPMSQNRCMLAIYVLPSLAMLSLAH